MKTDSDRQPTPGGQHAAAEPLRAELSVEVGTSRTRLFDYLADLENNPDWNWAVTTVRRLSPAAPNRPARYVQERSTSDVGDILEITILEHGYTLEISGSIEEGRISYRHELSEICRGATRLDTSIELIPGEPFIRPDLFASRLCSAATANLDSLRSILEERERRTHLTGRPT